MTSIFHNISINVSLSYTKDEITPELHDILVARLKKQLADNVDACVSQSIALASTSDEYHCQTIGKTE